MASSHLIPVWSVAAVVIVWVDVLYVGMMSNDNNKSYQSNLGRVRRSRTIAQ